MNVNRVVGPILALSAAVGMIFGAIVPKSAEAVATTYYCRVASRSQPVKLRMAFGSMLELSDSCRLWLGA